MPVVNLQRIADGTGTLAAQERAFALPPGWTIVDMPAGTLAGAPEGPAQLTGYLQLVAPAFSTGRTLPLVAGLSTIAGVTPFAAAGIRIVQPAELTGAVKVQLVAEVYASLNSMTAWASATSYSAGNARSNNGVGYICTHGGTSGSSTGPVGRGAGIADPGGSGGILWRAAAATLLVKAGAQGSGLTTLATLTTDYPLAYTSLGTSPITDALLTFDLTATLAGITVPWMVQGWLAGDASDPSNVTAGTATLVELRLS